MPSETSGVGLNHLPSGQRQVIAHNLARWTARIGLQLVTTKTLRRPRLTRSARRLTLHLPQGWPWENQFSAPWHPRAASPVLTAPVRH